MAEIYKTFNGMQFEEGLAHFEPVQGELAEELGEMSRAARALLAQHRHDGHARIETEHGDVDWHLILSDERGQQAAMAIEYGRGPNENGNGASAPLFILHRATGAAAKRTRPHSRRRKRLT